MDICIVLERLNKKPEMLTVNLEGDKILEWVGGDDQPTQAELEAEWAAYEAEGGQAKDEAKRNRSIAYTVEADPLFFQYQRGEIEKSVYDAKVAEIKARYPYPS